MKIKGKSVVLWSMPISSVDIQTEDFDAPDFGEKREDNL